MNKIALHTHLDNLFVQLQLSALICAHVCWFENTLQIKAPNHTNVEHTIFMRLKYCHINSGLTSSEWNTLTNKIFKFIMELEKCQKPSAH